MVKIEWDEIRGIELGSSGGWGSDFNEERMERDLILAKNMGFNAVKTWLTSDAYFDYGDEFIEKVRIFIELCSKHGFTASFLLFHTGGGSTPPRALGREIKWITAEEAYAQVEDFIDEIAREFNRPGWKIFFKGYVERYIKGAVIPFWGDPAQFFLQGSTMDPAYSEWGEEFFPKYDRYVTAVMEAFKDNENIILWDIMGEPYLIENYPWLFKLLDMKYDEEVVTTFLEHYCKLVASFKPKGAITVGTGSVAGIQRMEEKCGPYTDVISLHWFGPEPEEASELFQSAKSVASQREKPLLLTEWGNLTLHDSWLDDSRLLGTDEGQLKYYRDLYPVVESMKIGWYAYSLIAGDGPFANAGLLYPSGLNRPAANYLRKQLKK